MVHECLEGGGCVGEAKEHDRRFVKSKRGNEGRFPLILFSQLNIIISPPYIEFGEKGGILHVVDEFRDEG